MSAFASLLAGPPADAVVEIAGDAVCVASFAARGAETVVQAYAMEPLAAGAVVPSLAGPNVVDRRSVAEHLRSALGRLPARPRRVALLLPDIAGRVSLVRFERVPAREDELAQLVRWQVRKSAPFPIDEAAITYVPAGTSREGATEFLVVLVRRDVVRAYETLCEELGLHAGLVDLSTLGVVNLSLAAPAAGDRLLVHVRPEYTSLAVLSGGAVLFFRTLAADEVGSLADAVHQTTMYYQDRLGGQGFAQVVVGGIGTHPGAIDDVRREVEGRTGVPVQPLEALGTAAFADRIAAAPDLAARLAPLIGTWRRMGAGVRV